MKKKILIVEDNPQNMRLIEMTLESRDHSLLKATDGEEALNMAKTQRPDLIIMDVRLPQINGLEVTRKLRQIPAFNNTPIIALTAYAMKGDREMLIQSGCDAYLSKPFDTRELRNLITEILSRQKGNGKVRGGGDDGKEDSGY